MSCLIGCMHMCIFPVSKVLELTDGFSPYTYDREFNICCIYQTFCCIVEFTTFIPEQLLRMQLVAILSPFASISQVLCMHQTLVLTHNTIGWT